MLLAEDTQTRLLEAAGQVFAEKGFRSATVREILRRAAVQNLAAVNYYFGDKERLYEAALRHACQCRLRPEQLPEWPQGTPATVKLRHFIGVMLQRMLGKFQEQWQLQLMMAEFPQPSPAGEAVIRDFVQPVYEILWGLLREALPHASEEHIHLAGFSIVGQCLYHRIGARVIGLLVGEEQKGYDLDRLAAHIADFSLRGLGLESGVKA